jgi:hypothetical protein
LPASVVPNAFQCLTINPHHKQPFMATSVSSMVEQRST